MTVQIVEVIVGGVLLLALLGLALVVHLLPSGDDDSGCFVFLVGIALFIVACALLASAGVKGLQ